MSTSEPGAEQPMNRVKWLVTAVIWIAALSLAIAAPLPLSSAGHWALAGFLAALPVLILRPGSIPLAGAGILMMSIFLLGSVPPEVVFHGFTSSAFWTLVPALFFGHVLAKTGLGRRLAFYVIGVFHPTPLGMTLAWLCIGVILSLFTPSMTVRVSIMMPIALNVITALRLSPRSAESAYIGFLAFIGATVPGNGWYTGTLTGPIVHGMLPAAIAETVTWTSYSRALIVPFLLITVLLLGYLILLRRPRGIHVPEETLAEGRRQLGPISKQEIASAVILTSAFLAFVTIPWHHMSTAPICLAVLFIFFALGILKAEDIPVGINWELIIFLGAVLALPTVLTETGIVAWLEPSVKQMLTPLASSLFIFVPVVMVCLYLVRFLDVAYGLASMGLMLAFTPMLQAEFGIHPLVIAAISASVGLFFCLHYMSPFALISNSLLEEQGWSQGQLARLGVVYVVVSIISFVISIFYWRAIGIA